MPLLRLVACLACLVVGRPEGALTQEWDSPGTRALVDRAVARRTDGESAGSPHRWAADARGLVLFLSQIGGDQAAPQLVKADELAVEVYWEVPGRSKQSIVAWRDRAWLPTDINYHRDHLGIVANDFGPLIRIGDGDEVRDVPHPLSAASWQEYQFGLADSVAISSGDRTWQVYAVEVRPRDPSRPAIVGILYLDRDSAALVRFRFSFTRSAYREEGLEGITVVLENALQGGGFWLPWRQEIEIRRHLGPVDFPARGIIRGSWQLENFRIGDEAEALPTTGPSIGGLRAPGGPADRWFGSLEGRIEEVTGRLDRFDLEALRHELRRIQPGGLDGAGLLARPAFGAVSDLARFNRVEGLRLGMGAALQLAGGRASLRPWVGYGLANERLSARLQASLAVGGKSHLTLVAERLVMDIGQSPVISPVLNSILAQEFGVDRGAWTQRRSLGLRWQRALSPGMESRIEVGLEDWQPVETRAVPTRGSFAPNPEVGGGSFGVVRVGVGKSAGAPPGLAWQVGLEAGSGNPDYVRFFTEWSSERRLGSGALRFAGQLGWASQGTPVARRFVLGGWGSLPGTAYRAFGGHRIAVARVEWLTTVSLPAWALGSYPAVEGALRLGPFVAAGVTGGPGPSALPWAPSGGIRPVAGLAVEALFGLLRFDLGYGARGGVVSASFDMARAWWAVL